MHLSCETEVSGKHVPVLKDDTAIMKTDFQEFSFRMHVGENRVMLWSSVDLRWQSTLCLCLPPGQKPWIPSPSSGQLELMPSQHACLGRSKVLVQAAMLVPDPGPQSSYQPCGLIGPKTFHSNWSSTLLWGQKSVFVVSSSFLKRRSGGEYPNQREPLGQLLFLFWSLNSLVLEKGWMPSVPITGIYMESRGPYEWVLQHYVSIAPFSLPLHCGVVPGRWIYQLFTKRLQI